MKATHEARVGHGKLAVELRALVDRAKSTRSTRKAVGAAQDLLSRARGLPSSPVSSALCGMHHGSRPSDLCSPG